MGHGREAGAWLSLVAALVLFGAGFLKWAGFPGSVYVLRGYGASAYEPGGLELSMWQMTAASDVLFGVLAVTAAALAAVRLVTGRDTRTWLVFVLGALLAQSAGVWSFVQLAWPAAIAPLTGVVLCAASLLLLGRSAGTPGIPSGPARAALIAAGLAVALSGFAEVYADYDPAYGRIGGWDVAVATAGFGLAVATNAAGRSSGLMPMVLALGGACGAYALSVGLDVILAADDTVAGFHYGGPGWAAWALAFGVAPLALLGTVRAVRGAAA